MVEAATEPGERGFETGTNDVGKAFKNLLVKTQAGRDGWDRY
jgi:hypothetical protein